MIVNVNPDKDLMDEIKNYREEFIRLYRFLSDEIGARESWPLEIGLDGPINASIRLLRKYREQLAAVSEESKI